MAGKEATVYILDLGRSMGEKNHGRDRTDLDWALEYVWDKITTTVSRCSCGDLVCLTCSGMTLSLLFCEVLETIWRSRRRHLVQ